MNIALYIYICVCNYVYIIGYTYIISIVYQCWMISGYFRAFMVRSHGC